MKSFNEWFEENYSDLYKGKDLHDAFKLLAKHTWQAAKEVQRDSDAMIAYMHDNEFIGDKIRNNKAV